MAHLPQKGSPPPRPPFPLSALYGSKNGIQRISGFSEQPHSSVRTSLVPLSICLCGVFDLTATHRLNNLFLLMFSPSLLGKAGRFSVRYSRNFSPLLSRRAEIFENYSSTAAYIILSS